MFYEFLFPLGEEFPLFNVLKYISVRTVGGFFTGLLIFMIFGKKFIRFLIAHEVGQFIRGEGPKSHFEKKGTPTMGGVLISIAGLVSTLLWGDLHNSYVWLVVSVFIFFGFIGFLDDYKKQVKKENQGLDGKTKLLLQLTFAFVVGFIMVAFLDFSTELNVPFFKNFHPDLKGFYILMAVFVIVGSSNAVNLTDGLDGLVAMPNIVAFITYGIFVYVIGNYKLAGYLQVPFVKGVGELAIFCGAIAGAVMGFLWFNSYPAELFMGDVGSLSIGASLGTVALLAKAEILLVLVGGIFVLETVSVITQVISFKLTGKRVFRMAPLHHHYELKGWAEPKVITRFWIISFLLALMALATLKIR
ncbi:MAG: phospho-N-acetylmuramoyl-pentapeptide-transferase [Deltaproteobacteria bacterium]|nr:phospho-N-acetylmuramoyl-pentapeptide-transferase [Deltaproteobacteria bacterium]